MTGVVTSPLTKTVSLGLLLVYSLTLCCVYMLCWCVWVPSAGIG
jgi:hypothetical protein